MSERRHSCAECPLRTSLSTLCHLLSLWLWVSCCSFCEPNILFCKRERWCPARPPSWAVAVGEGRFHGAVWGCLPAGLHPQRAFVLQNSFTAASRTSDGRTEHRQGLHLPPVQSEVPPSPCSPPAPPARSRSSPCFLKSFQPLDLGHMEPHFHICFSEDFLVGRAGHNS